MLNLKKIAVTGAIGSGKTTACSYFKECGAYVISSDEIVHHLLNPQTDLGKELVALLGKEVVDGEHFNRGRIADKVFGDRLLLKKLEEKLHPEVLKEINRAYQRAKSIGTFALFVAEVPLLFEAHFEEDFDKIILIDCQDQMALQRLKKAKGFHKEEYMRRLSRLSPIEQKRERADFVVQNEDSLQSLQKELNNIYQQLTTI